MTLSEDFNFTEEGGEFAEGPSYPVLFGVTFTPRIIGILIGVGGLLGAVYMLLNLVMPDWEKFQAQETKRTEIQGQIDQKKASISQIDKVKEELAKAKQQQTQVLAVFANEKTLDTLLLDLNRLVEANNAIAPSGVRAKLKKYAPATQKAEPIIDGSLGALVDGKLKRSSVNIEFIGTYEQTQSILRNIERLQPLLLVKDYNSTLTPPEPVQPGKPQRRGGPAAITTAFQIQALMPLTPEEMAALAKPAKPQ